MLSELRGKPALAIDTESNSLYAYHEQVCLIQISTRQDDYLVDPLSLRDLSGLGPLLAIPSVLKVLHGAEYDLSVLHRDFEFAFSNLFDTMWASRILGWPAHGLAALIKEHYGVELNKKYQRANWGLRPLPREQLHYARQDTHYLLPLHDIQAQELDSQQRWPQALHRFNKLARSRWEPRGFDPDGFWRLPGARELDPRGRGVLRELFLFRDRCARAENRPTFKVLSNRTLVALSGQRPHDHKSLCRIKGISPRLARKYGQGLLDCIRRGVRQALPWSDRPRTPKRRNRYSNERPSAACKARFEALRAWRNDFAVRRGVEPDIVLTNQVLWAVAHRNPDTQAGLAHDELLAPWQVEEFGRELMAVLQNEH